ncbi:hypothetical protein ACQ4PT_053396 [Festuca glaucescens]
MASALDRFRELKAFDDTKSGVKGLVDAGVSTVPAIFHHPPGSLALDNTHDHHFVIPVIDLAGAWTPSRRAELVGEVKSAAETVGFFQAVNHGVPEAAMSQMLAAVRSFNEEPAEVKRVYYTRDDGRRVRYQTNFDLFQSPAANWRDTLYFEMEPNGPTPEEIPPACRGVVTDYTRLVRTLGGTVLELLSEALGLHRGYLEHDAGCLEGLNIAAHYYPACPEPRLTMGTTRHSDPSFFTVLLQDGVGGLQVIVEDEKLQPVWVDVPAVAGALIVNIGDFLQLMSNDRFKSVEHRVVSKSVGPRVSVACFFQSHGAAASTRVYGPIIQEGDPSPQLYRSTTVEEMLQHFREKGLDGSSALQHFRV